MRLSMRHFGLLLSMILVAQAAAQDKKVYRWVDRDGVVHYTDQPSGEGARPAQLPELQTYRPPPAPAPAPAAPQMAKPAAPEPSLSILSPAPDQTFRSAERTVPIVVAAEPQEGVRFRYYLNGQALTDTPIAATSFTAVGIDRGSHTISVAMVDSEGRELLRTGPVTVHLKPPTVPRPRGQ